MGNAFKRKEYEVRPRMCNKCNCSPPPHFNIRELKFNWSSAYNDECQTVPAYTRNTQHKFWVENVWNSFNNLSILMFEVLLPIDRFSVCELCFTLSFTTAYPYAHFYFAVRRALFKFYFLLCFWKPGWKMAFLTVVLCKPSRSRKRTINDTETHWKSVPPFSITGLWLLILYLKNWKERSNWLL